MEVPEGCSKSFRISFIQDEALRPETGECWLVETQSAALSSTGVKSSLKEAIEYATTTLGIVAKL